MKHLMLLLSLSLLMACSDESKKIIPVNPEKNKLNSAVRQLKWAQEKMVFISSLTNLPYDTIYNILLDYTIQIDEVKASSDSLWIKTASAINDLSSKYNLSKKKIARILFAYKYEMITREEIADEAIESEREQIVDERNDLEDN